MMPNPQTTPDEMAMPVIVWPQDEKDMVLIPGGVFAMGSNSGNPTHQPEHQVEVGIQSGIHAQADARLSHIILQNLLGNAWKYSQNEADPSIRFSAGEEDGQTVYRVTDNGVGFDMDHADKLFGVFERLHSVGEFEGVGVGLASVQRAVRRHGGWIQGKGELGKGAEFVFSLG